MAMAHCGSDSHRAGVDVIRSTEGIIDGEKKIRVILMCIPLRVEPVVSKKHYQNVFDPRGTL